MCWVQVNMYVCVLGKGSTRRFKQYLPKCSSGRARPEELGREETGGGAAQEGWVCFLPWYTQEPGAEMMAAPSMSLVDQLRLMFPLPGVMETRGSH